MVKEGVMEQTAYAEQGMTGKGNEGGKKVLECVLWNNYYVYLL